MKSCAKTAALLGIVVAAYGCKKKDEYGSSGTASPGTSAYASPYASPEATASSSAGTVVAPARIPVNVLAVDTKAPSITVTQATAGPRAAKPGGEPPPDTNAAARGTAGAIADRRTLAVDPMAAADLSRVKAGDMVTIMCSGTMPGATGTGAADTGTITASPGTPGDLANCTMVTSILTEPGTSARGR
jgi:hypothetical protein